MAGGVSKLNLAVFISGRGSNLQSLIDACAGPDFPAQIALVFSNKPDVQGLERAEKAGIPTQVLNHKGFESREDYDAAVLKILGNYPIDLVCLAGFMRIITPVLIEPWEGRMINIHPSLLPDYKGLHTHERVLADKKSEHGCTVHFVVPEMDAGPIIVQRRVPVLPGDTPDSLAERVLAEEHIAYPEAIRMIADKLSVETPLPDCV